MTRAIGLMKKPIQSVGERRGFAITRILTHWEDIVGPDLAAMCQPLKLGYSSGGLGATMTILVRGAHAPLVDMQKETIRTKVNACYGYNAVTRIHLTQTASTGFANGEAMFAQPEKKLPPKPDAEAVARAKEVTTEIQDEALRASLEALAANVISRAKRRTPQNGDKHD